MKNKSIQPKILVILGPTASGKSDLGVTLAKKYNGEVISADSRQVYKKLNIGTGKITKKEMLGVPHHMLDITSPKKQLTVQEYKERAQKYIDKILNKNKLPIICGGTGFYIQALVDNIIFPEVAPNLALRKKLQTKKVAELFTLLKKLDTKRAKTIDTKNPHRLIRAIEIATALGNVPESKAQPKYDALQIGIALEDSVLKKRIHNRLLKRMRAGMIEEVKRLHASGLSYKRMHELGLEYRYVALYLQKKKPFDSAQGKQQMLEKLESEIWHYAKRQKTWFKRDNRIQWFALKDKKKIEKIIENFITALGIIDDRNKNLEI